MCTGYVCYIMPVRSLVNRHSAGGVSDLQCPCIELATEQRESAVPRYE